MRSIWKGTVSFGLVSIGVKLYSATEERDVSFHQVRRTDGSRIRYKRVAEADGEEVAYSDIAKGFELPGGETVILTDSDFADLPLPTAKTVDVLQFVPIDQIDPIYFAKSYFLEPEKGALKPYVLLRDALADSGWPDGQGGDARAGAVGDLAGTRRGDAAQDDALSPTRCATRELPGILGEDVEGPTAGAARWPTRSSARWPASSSRRRTPTTTGRRCRRSSTRRSRAVRW